MSDIQGLISINKPAKLTSFQVVRHVKRITGAKKAGHCGTLDPMASGVLLVLLGGSTKLQEKFMELPKVYRAKFLLGIMTDTGDITGKIMAKKEFKDLKNEQLLEILNSFLGEIEQIPPMYSALKYGGRKLYELARKGIEVERSPRPVKIYSIEFLSLEDNVLELRIECSKGTYIRTLGEDIGKKLGCGATMTALCREKIGPFALDSAIDANDSQEFSKEKIINKMISEKDLASVFRNSKE